MKSTVGKPRALTDAQVKRILEWNEEMCQLRTWERQTKTMKEFAEELGVHPTTLSRFVVRQLIVYVDRAEDHRPGRPPILRDETVVAMIRAWYATTLLLEAIRKRLKTQEELADEMGVAPATIAAAVTSRGHYKQPSPEKRSTELLLRRKRLARLKDQHLY